MENPEVSAILNEPASNPNNCGGKGRSNHHFSGCTEYRAAFNWPPGSTQSTTTINHQIINSNNNNNSGPCSSTTVTTTSSISLDNGVKSQTIADFSEISATSLQPTSVAAITNNPNHQPAKSTSNQQQQQQSRLLAPGAAGLPSHSGGVVYGGGGGGSGGGSGGDRVKDRPQVLFNRATPPPVVDSKPSKHSSKTEYKKKFKPFSTYVYIPGSGWKKSKQIAKESDEQGGFASGTGRSTSEGALEWYGEVVERAKKACEFRSRSQFGHPIVGVDHLESIYRETSSNLWNQPKDRSIAALALATSHHLRVSTRSVKGNSRDSSRDSSKAASDRVTSSHYATAVISPSKETSVANKKQFADRSKPAAPKSAAATVPPRSKSTSDAKIKPSADKKRPGGAGAPGAKETSVDSEGGKIWLKPRKEDKQQSSVPAESAAAAPPLTELTSLSSTCTDNESEQKKNSLPPDVKKLLDGETTSTTTGTTGAFSLVNSVSLAPLLSPREKEGGKVDDSETASNANKSPNTSDDQPRSPRPNSLVSSITTTNGGSGLPSPSGIPEGPVKTTEIKSPEEVTGVKSPSPELWRVAIDTGADINWTEAKPSSGNLLGDNKLTENKDSGDIGMSDKIDSDFSIGTNANNNLDVNNQLDDETINKQPSTQETTSTSEANEDLYGPLSI